MLNNVKTKKKSVLNNQTEMHGIAYVLYARLP